MNNDTQLLPDMSLEEAETKHAELKALETVMRSRLLEMRDRKGWLALGYASFSDYGEKEWGYTQSYISRLTAAATIQEKLNMPIGINEIPESQLRPLSKVEDADKQIVWQEAIDRALAEGKKIGAKHVEEVVTEYIAKNQVLQQQLGNYQTMYSESNRQRDELRDNQQQIVDAKVSEERAKLLLENSNAIQQAERKALDAQAALKKLKKEQTKAIKDGVTKDLNTKKIEIDQLEYRIESLQKQEANLKQSRDLLNHENGVIKQHQDSISIVIEAIHDIKGALYLADESGNSPIELINAWDSLNIAITELAKQVSTFCNRSMGSVVLNGNLLPSHSMDDFGVENTFNGWGNA